MTLRDYGKARAVAELCGPKGAAVCDIYGYSLCKTVCDHGKTRVVTELCGPTGAGSV